MKTILEYLDLQTRLRPDKPAFCDESEQLTFSEIGILTQKIGTWLLQNGADGEPVGILLPRSARTLTAMLGIMRAGCPYVPMDPEMGSIRIRGIFSQVEMRFLITTEELSGLAESSGFAGKILLWEKVSDCEIELCDLEHRYEKILDTDPAYIVFTSGSSGVPKGVVGKHSAMLDYAEQLTRALRVTDKDVFGMQAPMYVDACLKELLSTVKMGASVWVIPKRLFLAPVALVRFLNDHAVTAICWVAPALSLVSSLHTFEEIVPRTLRTVAFGSERFPIRQLHIWQSHVFARYLNLYGPTECTGMSCWYEVDRPFTEGEMIPIGHPFENTEIFLLDENDHAAQEGEICIRGTCLCHGYWNDPEKTQKYFCQNPLRTQYPERIYRTGDRGRWNEKGELEYLGRIDDQIKHMGHRIELGELETAALAAGGVDETCAVFDPERNRIALAYTGSADRKDLTLALRSLVPDFMLPSKTIQLDRMPLTGNGKTDRQAVYGICFGRRDKK